MEKNVYIIGILLLCTFLYTVNAKESRDQIQHHDTSLTLNNNEAAPKTDGSSRVKRQDPYYNRRNRYPYPFPVIFGGLGVPIGGYGRGYGRGGFGGRGFGGTGFGGRGFGGRGIGGRAGGFGGFGGHGGIGGGGHGGGGRG